MGCVMDINIRSMMEFDSFIKLKYQDSVLWNHGKPTHPLYIDLWDSWQQSQKVAVPDGYVVVPKEPTEAMISNARDWSIKKYGKSIGFDGAIGCYKAMIEAVEKNDE